MEAVKIWEETITIPTYGIGQSDKNPMFLEKRVYQGSSGAVYPHPVIDKVFDEKTDQPYRVVFLENEYLKIMVMPELGGRIQMAYDKTNDYHFIYYNRVIKPALVGLAGPWISGGIEFNWPQHHRPSTFEPVDYTLEEHPDGGATVWVGETERMARTRGLAGISLRPGRAYIEIEGRLYNGTAEPQTFLWWANPAIAVDENHQSIFPPDVHAVFDHGKRDVSTFPIATGEYYKVDYSAGVDISRYKNIPVPTSYMAYHSDYNFVGSYDHGRRAGLLHVADHHVSPGKKQWTWGCGDFGQAWDRNLTDEDGPYIELMTGVFTDNQPDFSWLQPYESKTFTQYFMPYKQIARVKNATREAALALEVSEGEVQLGVYVTQVFEQIKICLTARGEALVEQVCALKPDAAWQHSVALPQGVQEHELLFQLYDGDRLLLSYQPAPPAEVTPPEPAQPALPPEQVATCEELFLTGLHLEQYRHATFDPMEYYAEALRRDPGDARNNNAMGLLLYRCGQFAQAEGHFRRAVERLTRRNPNPCDGEPYYNLGLALMRLGREDEAFDAFYKSTWNDGWQCAGFFMLARLASRRGEWSEALAFAERAIERNARHAKARMLKCGLLRRLGRGLELECFITESLRYDPLDFGAMNERVCQARGTGEEAEAVALLAALGSLMRDSEHNGLELAIDYMEAGFYPEAADVLERFECGTATYPMVYYYQGAIAALKGEKTKAVDYYDKAERACADYCFPNRIESYAVLQGAIEALPKSPRAHYYLGCLWYAKRQYDEAIAAWERSCEQDPSFPTTHRNLGLAYQNKRNDTEAALAAFAQAFKLNPEDARVGFEYDQLRIKAGVTPAERFAWLEANIRLVKQRDDFYLEWVKLLNTLGRHGDALAAIEKRQFHPWEGGEGKVPGQYILALRESAKQKLAAGLADEAMALLERARVYPHNLGEGKIAGAQENDLLYWIGEAQRMLENESAAREAFELATEGLTEPASAMYYNDQPPDTIFYQGLALQRLGREEEALGRFNKLIDYAESHIHDQVRIDYFAVSLPDFLVFDDDLNRRNEIHCRYMRGLGLLGLGRHSDACQEFEAVLAMEKGHQGAAIHLAMAKS